MPEVLQLGPFMIRLDWILLALSGFFGYVAMRRKVKKSAFCDQPLMDKFTNGLIIVFFVWKFSPLLFRPSILWEHPIGLLTMTGSVTGIWLGVAVALLYIDRALRRMEIPRLFLLDLICLGIVVSVFVYSLLGWQYGTATALPWGISIENPEFTYHPINIYLLLVTLPMLIWFWRNRSILGTGKGSVNVLTYYGMAVMLISFLKTKTSFLFGLSGEQFIYLSMMITGLMISILLRDKEQTSE